MKIWLLHVALVQLLSCAVVASAAFPNPFLPFLSMVRTDRGWFGWAWGAESTVSVVDRSPALSFSSRPAAFGPEFSSPILGYVIPVSSFTIPCNNESLPLTAIPDNTGCPRLCPWGPHHPDPSETWIALVQRGRCEFASKVREAQSLGARAVVVGGTDPDLSGLPDTLINMYSPSDASDIHIPSTYITHDAYSQVSNLIAASNTSHSGLQTLSLLITAEYSAWSWYSPIATFVVILLLPSALTFLTLMIHRMRASRAAQRERAPEDVVNRLPWRVWTGWEKDLEAAGPLNTDGGDSSSPEERPNLSRSTTAAIILAPSMNPGGGAGIRPDSDGEPSTSTHDQLTHNSTHVPWYATHQNECAICLCEFEKGDKVRVLPCLHIFHMEEVDEWLIKRKKLCPVCKRDVTESEEENTTAPQEPPSDERTPLLQQQREDTTDS